MLELLLHSTRGKELFGERRTLQAMLDFESGLARAQALLGLIPASAAEEISRCCKAELFDIEVLTQGATASGNLAIPMVKQLTALVRGHSVMAAGYVHFGATSQDAIDTGLILQLRSELSLIEERLKEACEAVADLTRNHRNTPMAGRTWLQHAVPVTFGLKTAGWLDSLLRHFERLGELRRRVLVLQFGGAAGTLASLGDQGIEVANALGKELGLAVPNLPWHANRDRISEAATFHGVLMGTLGKIARDLSLLMQTEIGEAAEPANAGSGGSSTMPQKKNPIVCAVVLSSAIRVPALVSTILTAMPQEHERGLGGWQAEWETLPEICTLTLGALEKLTAALRSLDVYPKSMQRNLHSSDGLLFAESVSMELVKSIGKKEAHKALQQASNSTRENRTHLRDVVIGSPEIMQHLTPAKIEELFDQENCMGVAHLLIERVLLAYEAVRNHATESKG
jgi:3-carboxy-cis,cis-muconate cycloisomerase